MTQRERLQALRQAALAAAAGLQAMLGGAEIVLEDGPREVGRCGVGSRGVGPCGVGSRGVGPCGVGSRGVAPRGDSLRGASLAEAVLHLARSAAAHLPGRHAASPAEEAGHPPAQSAHRLVETVHLPPKAARQPVEAAPPPSEAAHRPGEAAHLPSEAAHRPGEAAHPPAKAAHPPAEGAHPPAEAAPAGQKGPALTLAIYPAPELAPLAAALGLDGEPLAPDGDHAADATTRELAWLPLLPGWSTYRTFPGSRLLAVAGYRRAALVAFEAAGRPAPMGRPPESHWQAQMWAPLGCDALAAALAPTERGPLFMEAPARLRDAIRTGRVRRALLGGADLTWALEQPGARAVRPLTGPGLDWMPVWGLFSRGVRLNLPDPPPELDAHLVLAPAEAAPGLTGWLEGAVVT